MGIFRRIKTTNAVTDIKNKDKIVQRKSLYSQLQSQIQGMEEQLKDSQGTIETLERQLVQAGIKGKVMQAEMEIHSKKEEVKSSLNKQYVETEGKQKLLRNNMSKDALMAQARMGDQVANTQKDLEREKKDLESSKENE